MSKTVKGMAERELKARFEGIEECVVVSLRGVGGTENNDMRRELCERDIRITVVKNSLARRAFRGLGQEALGEYLSGPSAIAYGSDSIIDLVKALMDLDKKLYSFEIKGSLLEGKVLDQASTVALSKLPNRAELQGSVVMLASAPGARLVSAVGSPAGAIAGCLKTLIENLEKAA